MLTDYPEVDSWLRVLPDGRVEVVAEAGDDVMAAFEEKLREGPSFSAVEGLDRSPIEARGDRGFHIR